MAFQSALGGLLGGGAPSPMGAPPAARPIAPPPSNPQAGPPPYDVAHDPAWKGIVDPNDHAFRNFLNQISPEERQMLRAKLGGGPALGGAPNPAMPPPGLLG